jgi:hypothetical protein
MQVDSSQDVDYFALDAAAFLNSPSMQAAIDMLSAHFAAISDEDTMSNSSTTSPSRSLFSTRGAPNLPAKSGRRPRFRARPTSGAYSMSSQSSHYPSDEESMSLAKLTTANYTYDKTSAFHEDLPEMKPRGRSITPRDVPASTPGLFSNNHRRISSNTATLSGTDSQRSSGDYTNADTRTASAQHRAAAEAYKQSRESRRAQRMQKHRGLQVSWL